MLQVASSKNPRNPIKPDNNMIDIHHPPVLQRIVDEIIASECPSYEPIQPAKSYKNIKFVIIGMLGLFLVSVIIHVITNSLSTTKDVSQKKHRGYTTTSVATENDIADKIITKANKKSTISLDNHVIDKNTRQHIQNQKKQNIQNRNIITAKRVPTQIEKPQRLTPIQAKKEAITKNKKDLEYKPPRQTRKYTENPVRFYSTDSSKTKRRADPYVSKGYSFLPKKIDTMKQRKEREKLEEIIRTYVPQPYTHVTRRSYSYNRYIPKSGIKRSSQRSYRFYRYVPSSRHSRNKELIHAFMNGGIERR